MEAQDGLEFALVFFFGSYGVEGREGHVEGQETRYRSIDPIDKVLEQIFLSHFGDTFAATSVRLPGRTEMKCCFSLIAGRTDSKNWEEVKVWTELQKLITSVSNCPTLLCSSLTLSMTTWVV